MGRGGSTAAGADWWRSGRCFPQQFRRPTHRKKQGELRCRLAIFRTRDCNFKLAFSQESAAAKSPFSYRNTMEQSVHSGLSATAPQEAALARPSHSGSIRPPLRSGRYAFLAIPARNVSPSVRAGMHFSHTGQRNVPPPSRCPVFFLSARCLGLDAQVSCPCSTRSDPCRGESLCCRGEPLSCPDCSLMS